jgi:hypothetical protein
VTGARLARWLALAVAVVAGAGCARSGPETRARPPAEELARAEAEQRRAEAELAALGASAQPPDCRRVCELGGNVCALARRICALAAQVPGDADTQARCRDAEARCGRAADLARERCGCAPPP